MLYICLPTGRVCVVFLPVDDPLLAEWCPSVVETTAPTRAAFIFNTNLSSYHLIQLAVSFPVPLLISHHSRIIQATFDSSTIDPSQASWFLIHVKNALQSLQIHVLSKCNDCTTPLSCNRFLLRPADTLGCSCSYDDITKLSQIPLSSHTERLLFGCITSRKCHVLRDFPGENLLQEFFLENVRTNPMSIVFCSQLISGDGVASVMEMSYISCYREALRLVGELQSAGISSRHVVPIISSQPLGIAISVIAVLLSGAAYIIIEPQLMDYLNIQNCLHLGEDQSPVALVHHDHHIQFADLNTVLIRAHGFIQNEVEVSQPLDAHSSIVLPQTGGDRVAFVTFSPTQEHSKTTSITHADARDLLRTHCSALGITNASRVLITRSCSAELCHGIIWNTLIVNLSLLSSRKCLIVYS